MVPVAQLALSLHPNPFNPEVRLIVDLPTGGPLLVEVFDIAGRRIAQLFEGLAPEGELEFRWNGRDPQDRACPSGIYLFRARGAETVQSVKGMLLK